MQNFKTSRFEFVPQFLPSEEIDSPLAVSTRNPRLSKSSDRAYPRRDELFQDENGNLYLYKVINGVHKYVKISADSASGSDNGTVINADVFMPYERLAKIEKQGLNSAVFEDGIIAIADNNKLKFYKQSETAKELEHISNSDITLNPDQVAYFQHKFGVFTYKNGETSFRVLIGYKFTPVGGEGSTFGTVTLQAFKLNSDLNSTTTIYTIENFGSTYSWDNGNEFCPQVNVLKDSDNSIRIYAVNVVIKATVSTTGIVYDPEQVAQTSSNLYAAGMVAGNTNAMLDTGYMAPTMKLYMQGVDGYVTIPSGGNRARSHIAILNVRRDNTRSNTTGAYGVVSISDNANDENNYVFTTDLYNPDNPSNTTVVETRFDCSFDEDETVIRVLDNSQIVNHTNVQDGYEKIVMSFVVITRKNDIYNAYLFYVAPNKIEVANNGSNLNEPYEDSTYTVIKAGKYQFIGSEEITKMESTSYLYLLDNGDILENRSTGIVLYAASQFRYLSAAFADSLFAANLKAIITEFRHGYADTISSKSEKVSNVNAAKENVSVLDNPVLNKKIFNIDSYNIVAKDAFLNKDGTYCISQDYICRFVENNTKLLINDKIIAVSGVKNYKHLTWHIVNNEKIIGMGAYIGDFITQNYIAGLEIEGTIADILATGKAVCKEAKKLVSGVAGFAVSQKYVGASYYEEEHPVVADNENISTYTDDSIIQIYTITLTSGPQAGAEKYIIAETTWESHDYNRHASSYDSRDIKPGEVILSNYVWTPRSPNCYQYTVNYNRRDNSSGRYFFMAFAISSTSSGGYTNSTGIIRILRPRFFSYEYSCVDPIEFRDDRNLLSYNFDKLIISAKSENIASVIVYKTDSHFVLSYNYQSNSYNTIDYDADIIEVTDIADDENLYLLFSDSGVYYHIDPDNNLLLLNNSLKSSYYEEGVELSELVIGVYNGYLFRYDVDSSSKIVAVSLTNNTVNASDINSDRIYGDSAVIKDIASKKIKSKEITSETASTQVLKIGDATIRYENNVSTQPSLRLYDRQVFSEKLTNAVKSYLHPNYVVNKYTSMHLCEKNSGRFQSSADIITTNTQTVALSIRGSRVHNNYHQIFFNLHSNAIDVNFMFDSAPSYYSRTIEVDENGKLDTTSYQHFFTDEYTAYSYNKGLHMSVYSQFEDIYNTSFNTGFGVAREDYSQTEGMWGMTPPTDHTGINKNYYNLTSINMTAPATYDSTYHFYSMRAVYIKDHDDQVYVIIKSISVKNNLDDNLLDIDFQDHPLVLNVYTPNDDSYYFINESGAEITLPYNYTLCEKGMTDALYYPKFSESEIRELNIHGRKIMLTPLNICFDAHKNSHTFPIVATNGLMVVDYTDGNITKDNAYYIPYVQKKMKLDAAQANGNYGAYVDTTDVLKDTNTLPSEVLTSSANRILGTDGDHLPFILDVCIQVEETGDYSTDIKILVASLVPGRAVSNTHQYSLYNPNNQFSSTTFSYDYSKNRWSYSARRVANYCGLSLFNDPSHLTYDGVMINAIKISKGDNSIHVSNGNSPDGYVGVWASTEFYANVFRATVDNGSGLYGNSMRGTTPDKSVDFRFMRNGRYYTITQTIPVAAYKYVTCGSDSHDVYIPIIQPEYEYYTKNTYLGGIRIGDDGVRIIGNTIYPLYASADTDPTHTYSNSITKVVYSKYNYAYSLDYGITTVVSSYTDKIFIDEDNLLNVAVPSDQCTNFFKFNDISATVLNATKYTSSYIGAHSETAITMANAPFASEITAFELPNNFNMRFPLAIGCLLPCGRENSGSPTDSLAMCSFGVEIDWYNDTLIFTDIRNDYSSFDPYSMYYYGELFYSVINGGRERVGSVDNTTPMSDKLRFYDNTNLVYGQPEKKKYVVDNYLPIMVHNKRIDYSRYYSSIEGYTGYRNVWLLSPNISKLNNSMYVFSLYCQGTKVTDATGYLDLGEDSIFYTTPLPASYIYRNIIPAPEGFVTIGNDGARYITNVEDTPTVTLYTYKSLMNIGDVNLIVYNSTDDSRKDVYVVSDRDVADMDNCEYSAISDADSVTSGGVIVTDTPIEYRINANIYL